MTFAPAPQYALPAPITNRWVRNGKYPESGLQTDIATQMNQAAMWRTKEPFSYTCPLASIPGSTAAPSTRNRWRWAWRSGPYARYLWIMGQYAHVSDIAITGDPLVRWLITNGAGATVGTVDIHASIVASSTDYPNAMTTFVAPLFNSGSIVTLTANTEYFGLLSDIDGARLVSATVYETSLENDTANGYTLGVAAGSPILDTDRQTVLTMGRNLWKQGGAQLLCWSVDNQASPRTHASGDPARNIIDTTVTTVSAASPGFVLDFTNRTRISGTGVPVVMKAYAARGAANGYIYLKDSGGTTRATIEVDSSAAWYSTGNIFIPSASGKYDLQFESTGGDLSLYAVSLYSYAA